MTPRLFAAAAFLLVPSLAFAGPRPTLPDWAHHPKAEPNLQLAAGIAHARGEIGDVIALIVEVDRLPDPALIDELEAAGARLHRDKRGLRHIGRFVGLKVRSDRAHELLSSPRIVRAEAPRPVLPRPHGAAADSATLAHRIMESRMGNVEATWMSDGDDRRIQGHGVTAAVVDFNLDPFHPSLYHADAGTFSWLDADDNGRFDVGVDAVDLDGDGAVGAGEVLQLAEFPTVVPRGMGVDSDSDSRFTPFNDYLFIDENRNGERDVGDAVGANSQTPGLAEPTFVGDDADGDGQLDPTERLFRLGTPRVKLIYDVGRDHAFAPGPGYTEYLDSIRTGRDGSRIEFHGTYECTRVAGGHSEIQHMGGLAPAADLVFIDIEEGTTNFFGGGDLVTGLNWLLQHGARPFNYAFGSVAAEYADGSSILEQTLAALHADGRLQSASAGNEGRSPAHGIFDVGARSEASLVVNVGRQQLAAGVVFLTLRWRGAARVELQSVTAPDGTIIDPDATAPLPLDRIEVQLQHFGGTSPRHTRMEGLMIAATNGARLPSGQWTYALRNRASEVGSVDVWVGTDLPFPMATLVSESILSSRQTITHPATADGIYTVGACSPVYDNAFAGGPDDCNLAPYSSLGPRIDGERQLALVAPTEMLAGYPLLRFEGGYLPFGGTSGASPHVTGAAALMMQLMDSEGAEPQTADERMRAALFTSPNMGELPSIAWGEGLLDVWRSLFTDLSRPDEAAAATLELIAPESAEPGASVAVRAALFREAVEIEVPGAQLWIDAGYDGVFETGPVAGLEASVKMPESGAGLAVRAQVRDGEGRGYGAVAWIEADGEASEPIDNPATDAGTPVTRDAGETDIQSATDTKDSADVRVSDGRERVASSGGGCSVAAAGGAAGGAAWLLLFVSAIVVARRRQGLSYSSNGSMVASDSA